MDCIIIEHRKIVYVILFTAIIFLTLPFARSISNYLEIHNLLKYSVYSIIFIFITICCISTFKYIGLNLLNVAILLIFFIIYMTIIQRYKIMVEKIHFIEYGILAFLIFSALKEYSKNTTIYLTSFIILSCIGWIDEIIQHFLPDRLYDIRDVFLNSLSGTLILIFIYVVEKLKSYDYQNIQIDKT